MGMSNAHIGKEDGTFQSFIDDFIAMLQQCEEHGKAARLSIMSGAARRVTVDIYSTPEGLAELETAYLNTLNGKDPNGTQGNSTDSAT